MFHRVDDMDELDGPRLLRLAVRLPFYDGVLRARLTAEAAGNTTPTPSAGGTSYTPQEVTPAAAALDPVLAGLVSFG